MFSEFKEQYPEVYEKTEALGEFIHHEGGPLEDKTRWLIKLGISAAPRHQNAVGTHIARAREAGATEEEIMHALLLVIPTCGFPTFTEPTAYTRRWSSDDERTSDGRGDRSQRSRDPLRTPG
jgi:alkylhydroperoxidase/carboxymuconolactone decarboxylase family protein YurZ